MPVEPGTTTSSTVAADMVPVYLRTQQLAIAQKDTVFYDLCDEIDMPEGEGTVIQCNRFERFPLPTQPAQEGVTPTAVPLTLSTVQAVLDEWIMVASITTRATLTAKHPLIQIGNSRLGTAMGELIDRECIRVASGGANTIFGGGKASRSLLVAGDNLTSDLVSQGVATLRQLGAPGYDGKKRFVGVHDPYVEQDLQKDPTYVQAHSYADAVALMNGESGLWKGARWKTSNLLPIISLLAGANYDASAQDIGAPQAGETNFDAASTVRVVVTSLDATYGTETLVSVVVAVTDAASFSVRARVLAAAPSGTYRIYVGLQGATVTTLQTEVVHVTGTTDAKTFVKAGTPNGSNRYVTQGTGPAAPPAPPATGNVHISFLFGKGALGCSKLGKKWESNITPPVASDSDPAKQRRKMSAKTFFKPVILNTDFFRRYETLSAFN